MLNKSTALSSGATQTYQKHVLSKAWSVSEKKYSRKSPRQDWENPVLDSCQMHEVQCCSVKRQQSILLVYALSAVLSSKRPSSLAIKVSPRPTTEFDKFVMWA